MQVYSWTNENGKKSLLEQKIFFVKEKNDQKGALIPKQEDYCCLYYPPLAFHISHHNIAIHGKRKLAI
jgi:hypothetical protein